MLLSIVDLLEQKLGANKVLKEGELKDRYTHIWKMDEPLLAKAVVLPQSTEDVSIVLKLCHRYHQSVVLHGGLTNLVGSTETKASDIVMSLERMDQIEELDEMSRSMTVQAGVILENVQNYADEKDLLFPLNFGAKGSAQIGGAISTNAGGLRVLRYGMTRNLILGLEVVMADGTIVSSLKKVIKDNSGYDLKQLFIGAEGTLGVVTRAVLKLVSKPKSRNSAFVAFNEYPKVVDFLKYVDVGLAGTLSGFELIWQETYRTMTGPQTEVNPPLPSSYKYYVLIESLGSNQKTDHELLQSLLEISIEKEMILDGCLAHNESDMQWFWKIREDVHVLSSQCTVDQHFDISLPIPLIGEIIGQITRKILAIPEVEKCFPFGHVMDGNIHFIIGKPNDDQELTNKINDIVYGPLKAIGGSISAEHGIGIHKKPYLHISRSSEEIELMKVLKKALDPRGILNPGKILDIE